METDNSQLSNEHKQLLQNLADIRAQFSQKRMKAGLVMRGKYDFIITQLVNSGKALIVLDAVQFNNGSESSMQQAFTKACVKLNRNPLIVVFFNGKKLLIDYDNPNVGSELEDFFREEAGVSKEVLYAEASSLDKDLRNLDPDIEDNEDTTDTE
jgi:hypothetical protein